MSEVLNAKELKELLQQQQNSKMIELSQSYHPADFATLLEDLNYKDASDIFDIIPIQRSAKMISYFSEEFIIKFADYLGVKRMSQILNYMHPDDRADLLQLFDNELADQLLQSMTRAKREETTKLAAYPEESVGSVMTTDFATLSPEMTVKQAIEKLKKEATGKETINRTYVVDNDNKLMGTVKLQNLIMADEARLVQDVMKRHTFAVNLSDTPEFAAKQISKYDVIALPVVDEKNCLVGIVTYDDAIDVLEEEATEDFHQHGSIGKIDGDILAQSKFYLYRKRIGWLVLLVFGNIFSGAGIAYFEDTIAAYVALVFFLPLLIDSGGNAGSQAATLMVRALATGDVVLRDWSRMVGREVVIAAGLGLSMALAVSILGIFRGGTEIALVVSLTMVCVVIVGSIVGMSLPFLLHRFNFDPATASAPLITSIADALGVLIYFAIATAILPPMLV